MIKIGIFGSLDAKSIPDNPYHVDAGEYRALVTNAYFHRNEDKDLDQLVIVYTIQDETSKFHNRSVSDWFTIFPQLTEEEVALLSPEEERKVEGAMSAVRRRLCGQPKFNRPGLGVPVEDLNDPEWDPKTLMNTEVDLAVVNSGEENEYTNIRWVNKVD